MHKQILWHIGPRSYIYNINNESNKYVVIIFVFTSVSLTFSSPLPAPDSS